MQLHSILFYQILFYYVVFCSIISEVELESVVKIWSRREAGPRGVGPRRRGHRRRGSQATAALSMEPATEQRRLPVASATANPSRIGRAAPVTRCAQSRSAVESAPRRCFRYFLGILCRNSNGLGCHRHWPRRSAPAIAKSYSTNEFQIFDGFNTLRF